MCAAHRRSSPASSDCLSRLRAAKETALLGNRSTTYVAKGSRSRFWSARSGGSSNELSRAGRPEASQSATPDESLCGVNGWCLLLRQRGNVMDATLVILLDMEMPAIYGEACLTLHGLGHV